MSTYTIDQRVEVRMLGDWIGGVVVSEVRSGIVYEVETGIHAQVGKFNVSRMRAVPENRSVGRPALFDEPRVRLDAKVPASLKAEFCALPGSMTGNLIKAMKQFLEGTK